MFLIIYIALSKQKSDDSSLRPVTPKSNEGEPTDLEQSDKYKAYVINKFGPNSGEVLQILGELRDLRELFKLLETQTNEIKTYGSLDINNF